MTTLCTSENQFGFMKNHATDLCIYTVKSVIKSYNYFSRRFRRPILYLKPNFEKKKIFKIQLFWHKE